MKKENFLQIKFLNIEIKIPNFEMESQNNVITIEIFAIKNLKLKIKEYNFEIQSKNLSYRFQTER